MRHDAALCYVMFILWGMPPPCGLHAQRDLYGFQEGIPLVGWVGLGQGTAIVCPGIQAGFVVERRDNGGGSEGASYVRRTTND